MKRRQLNMLQGPLLSNIISYTVPIVLTNILQLLFNAADLMVVGQHCGSVSVAAVGATHSLTHLIVNLFIGMSVGAGATMANALGRHDDRMVHRILHTALPTALVCGAVLTVIGVACSKTFLIWMKTPEDVLELSAVYMRIYFGGIIFTMVYNFSAAILRAAGDTKKPLIFLILAGILNVLLNLLFVKAFQMNVAGVAWATTISQGVSAALTVWALCQRTDNCRLKLRSIRFYKDALKPIMVQGVPAGIRSSLFSVSNVIIQSSFNAFGPAVVSGNSAANSIEGFIYASNSAFSQTALNFTGQNIGAGQYERAKKITWIVSGCAIAAGLILGSVARMFAQQLLSLYITDSPEALGYGLLRAKYVWVLFAVSGLMEVCNGTLQGMQKPIQPMVMTILGVCVFRVVWVYTVFQMPQFHTVDSLFVSYPISWVLTCLALLTTCVWLYKKRFSSEKSPISQGGSC